MSKSDLINIVSIGGGGGHAQILKGLKKISGIRITAICPSTDSGGSTGLLSRDYGSLGYLGDLTKCIAALCPSEALSQALLYRFGDGCLVGHSVKNIVLLGLEKINGTKVGLELMHEVCSIRSHKVIPATTERTELHARLRIGSEISGETQIDHIAKNPLWHPDYHAIEDIFLNPDVSASDQALEAISNSSLCVICPGDLYSSIIPVLLPKGMKEAFRENRKRVKVVLVANIMTKKGETDEYHLRDFINQVEKYLGIPVDVILCNNSEIGRDLLVKYALEQKIQLVDPVAEDDSRIRFAPLVLVTEEGQVCHNPQSVADELEKIIDQ